MLIRSTIAFLFQQFMHISGHRSENKPGSRPVLSREEETFLMDVIERYRAWRQPLTRLDLI